MAILFAPDTPNGEQRLPPDISKWLRRQGVMVRLQRLENTSVNTLKRAIESGGNGTLVLSSTILHLASLQKLLDEVDCPVLLVR
jgi:hypothetical protein